MRRVAVEATHPLLDGLLRFTSRPASALTLVNRTQWATVTTQEGERRRYLRRSLHSFKSEKSIRRGNIHRLSNGNLTPTLLIDLHSARLEAGSN
jgi:hypothetical protein